MRSVQRQVLHVFACLCVASSQAQYSGPESVEYDAAGDRYFVSNTAIGVIKVRDQSGVVTDFASVSPAPYGLEIMGDTLFACSGGGVKGYRLSDGALVFNRSLGGTFCNGITTDGQFLYVTDFSSSAQRIYKVDVANNSHTTLVSNTGGQPNGIVHLPGTDELLVAFWGSNAAVKSYDRNTGVLNGSVSTGLTNIDGITVDCFGRVVIASWSPDRISVFDWGVMSPTFTDLLVPGLNNPADIDFDTFNQRICIPNSGNNTVSLFELNCPLGIRSASLPAVSRAVPNPTSGVLRIEPALTTDEPYLLLDARGLLVGGGTLKAGAQLDISGLPSGRYAIQLTRRGTVLQVVKE
jgi:DNA-binding beta-propeller fold protein YncE